MPSPWLWAACHFRASLCSLCTERYRTSVEAKQHEVFEPKGIENPKWTRRSLKRQRNKTLRILKLDERARISFGQCNSFTFGVTFFLVHFAALALCVKRGISLFSAGFPVTSQTKSKTCYSLCLRSYRQSRLKDWMRMSKTLLVEHLAE